MKENTQKENLKIVIAPDKFKGSLSASEVACAMERSFEEVKCIVKKFPMADGGEGSLAVVKNSLAGRGEREVNVNTVNSIGHPISAPMLLINGGDTAFIEMAQSAGLQQLSPEERNPRFTTTYGFGVMIRSAIVDFGAKEVVLAIGGSATNDGGIGLLTALGYRFKISANFPSKDVSLLLKSVVEINNSLVGFTTPGLDRVKIKVACDVENPLLGTNGATMVYGGQKGGELGTLEELEQGMTNWDKVVSSYSGTTGIYPGEGAAGGTGFALRRVLGAELVKGWKLFSEMVRLEEEISNADLVITGEGSFDSQSLEGKLPFGIASICRKHGKRLWLVCGRNSVPQEQWRAAGIEKVLPLSEIEPDIEKCINNASSLIVKIIKNELT